MEEEVKFQLNIVQLHSNKDVKDRTKWMREVFDPYLPNAERKLSHTKGKREREASPFEI